MKDWVLLLTAIINMITAAINLRKGRKKEKGTPRRKLRRRRTK